MAKTFEISPLQYNLQNYQGNDTGLITSFEIDTNLTGSSCIEFLVYSENGDVQYSNYNHTNYSVLNNKESQISNIELTPGEDLETAGFDVGTNVAYYNFFIKRIGEPLTSLYISEISSDRTEVRLKSSFLSNPELITQTNEFIQFRNDQDYFVDFLLNFGDNELLISNNIRLDNENTSDPSILVKLYDSLPSSFNLKDELWIVTKFSEPEAYRVTFTPNVYIPGDSLLMSGPNFNIPIKDQINNSSANLSENDILLGASTSSFNQVQNIISSSNININVDYTNFSDFTHFSSAKTRLENFQYKLGLLENYSSSIATLNPVIGSNNSNQIINQKITNIISNFDGFEYYMYYNSGSKSWPKTNNTLPYTLAKINSAEALTWYGSDNESSSNFGGMILSASNYDNENPDQLLKSIPEYLREDPQNKPYELFVDMVAQYYDNVWLYTKDITQKYNADNRLDFGVSKDLVADAIRDFGLKLYQNNFSNKELYTAFLGLTPGGSTFPFPEITGSMPAPTGFEFVDTLISASNDVISMDDTNKSLYKRLYHNIPYLLNTKGTLTGLRALITSYGIPDTILKISEFGGKDKVNANDWDLYFNNFNYAWNTQGTNNLSTPWEVNPLFQIQPESSPGTVEFRFKTNGIPPKPEAPSTTVVSASMMIKGFKTTNHTNDTAIIENVQTNATSFNDFLSLCPQKLFFASVSNGRFGWYGQLSGGGSWSSNSRKSASIIDITPSSSLGEYEVILTGSDYFKNRRSVPNQALPYSASIVSGSFEVLNEAVVPDAGGGVFNYGGSISQTLTPTNSQALWLTNSGSIVNKAVVLEYSGSYLESGSYSGSILDPYNEYGTLKYISNPGTANEVSCSVYLPFFDGGWWSIMARNNGFSNDIDYIITEPYIYDFIIGEDGKYIVEESANTSSLDNLGNINLYASNKIYNGNNGTSLGFFATSSINSASASGSWFSGITSSFAKGFTTGSTYNNFSGSIQEIRYYNVALGTTSFKDYTMNPLSYEGNGINSAPNQLTFRAALGSELDTTTFSSIHPKVTGSWTTISSFSGSNSIFNFNTTPLYNSNTEYFFLDQPAVGIKNRTTDKIRSENSTIPSGSVLSSIRSLSQNIEASASYTDNINYLEVAFSPQNQINDDIIGQLGHFNIGDYIGDPRQRSSSAQIYPDLNNLSEDYFKKYIKQYDLTDFVRLIKFFDNSLFKMIKDFIPTRTSLASGLVIKQHLLERNKYPQPQVSYENKIYTGSIDMYQISGGAGGVFNQFNSTKTSPLGSLGQGPDNKFNITQSWLVTTPSLTGSITSLHDSQAEFYNGELSGSTIIVSNGELNPLNTFKSQATSPSTPYSVRIYYSGDYYTGGLPFNPEILFGDDNNKPLNGNIQIWGNGVESLNTMNKIDYIKIAKTDKNGNDNSNYLSQINKLVLPSFNGSTHPLPDNIEYTLEPAFSFEYSTYFSYKVVSSTRNSDGDYIPWRNRSYIVDGYIFTGSFQSSPFDITINDNKPSWPLRIIPISKSLGDSLNAFDPTLPIPSYVLPTLNQKDITWKLSGSIVTNGSGSGTNASGSLGFYYNESLSNSGSFSSQFGFQGLGGAMNFPPNSTSSIDLTFDLKSYSNVSSYYPPMAGAQISLYIKKGVFNSNVTSGCSITEAYFTPDTRIFLSSTVGTGSNPLPSNVKNLDTTLIPFFKDKFQNSDYDVLLGDVDAARPNPYLQDLDYQTSQTVPVNYEVVLNQSATRATVPVSYYTTPSQINNRYIGSKNQSSNFNVFNPTAGLTSFGDPVNQGTYGQTPSVDDKNIMVYEFEWGGGTTPEILGWGAVKMNNILQVDSPEAVKTIQKTQDLKKKPYIDDRLTTTSEANIKSYRRSYNNLDNPPATGSVIYNSSGDKKYFWIISQSRGEFYEILNGNNPVNTNIQLGNYGNNPSTDPIMPNTTKIASTGWSVPIISNYMLTSSYSGGVTVPTTTPSTSSVAYNISGSYGYVKKTQPTLFIFKYNNEISKVKKNIDGFYKVGDSIRLLTDEVTDEINSGMTNGERWYITLFRELESAGNSGSLEESLTVGTVLQPYNEGYDTLNSEGNYDYPLASKGVYEIIGTDPSFDSGFYGSSVMFFQVHPKINFPESGSTGSTYGQLNIGTSKSTRSGQHEGSPTNGIGALIWQAVGKEQIAGEEYVILQDEISGVGPGYFLNKFSPEYITDNIENITKTYGSNKQ